MLEQVRPDKCVFCGGGGCGARLGKVVCNRRCDCREGPTFSGAITCLVSLNHSDDVS